MSNRLKILVAAFFVLLLILLAPFLTTRRSRSQSEAVSQRLKDSKTKKDSLRSAMRYLERMTPLNRQHTSKEVQLALNTWIQSADVSQASYKPPKTMSGLPPEMLDMVGAKSEIGLEFSEWDVDYLFQCRLMGQLAQWVVAFPVRDSLFEPILEERAKQLSPEEGLKLIEAYKLFDWTMRNVGLEPNLASVETKTPNPAGPISEYGAGYSYLPWETLLFSMGDVIEKGRVFTALAGQRDIPTAWIVDAGKVWAIGVLVGGEIFVFEPKISMPVLDPDRLTLATLEEAKTNERILRRLDLPGRFDYAFDPGSLNFLELFVDLPPTAVSARMKLLEQKLLGNERMRCYFDLDALIEGFQEAAPKATVKIWDLPLKAQVHAMMIRDRLDTTTDFTREYMTMHGIWMMDNPAANGRLKHLYGDFENSLDGEGALSLYMSCRYDAETLRLLADHPQVQRELGFEKNPNESMEQFRDRLLKAIFVLRRAKVDASFLLAQLHFDRGSYQEASSWFLKRIINNDKEYEEELAERWEHISRYGLARAYQELGEIEKFEEQLSVDAGPHEAGNRLRLRYWKQTHEDKQQADSEEQS